MKCKHGKSQLGGCLECIKKAMQLLATAGGIPESDPEDHHLDARSYTIGNLMKGMVNEMEAELARKDCQCIMSVGDNADCRLHVTAPNAIKHPTHYNWFDIECADVTDHFNFNLGNAIKYIWRAGHKGAAIKDLRKAIVYIEREIAQQEKKHIEASLDVEQNSQ